jgi:hypothetical protein
VRDFWDDNRVVDGGRDPEAVNDEGARRSGIRRRDPRVWSDRVHPADVKHLLDEGRYLDLLALLKETQMHAPQDAELARSIAHLERAVNASLARRAE